MAETFTYDNSPDTEVLTEEEQDSLAVGEQLMEQQENLLAGKYKNAQDLESAYIELQKKLGKAKKQKVTEEPEAEESEILLCGHAHLLPLKSMLKKGEMSQETIDALSEMDSEESGQCIRSYASKRTCCTTGC